jgi:hypothetical protein
MYARLVESRVFLSLSLSVTRLFFSFLSRTTTPRMNAAPIHSTPLYFFTLDKTALLAVFRGQEQTPVVVQVTVKSAKGWVVNLAQLKADIYFFFFF